MANMSTNTIQELYSNVVADLVPFFSTKVLLPNPGILEYNYNIEGSLGNQMQIPLTNSWPLGNVSVADNTSLINDGFNFDPTSLALTVKKRGAGVTVSNEALEDGLATVTNAVVTRLSAAISEATDKAGFNTFLSGAETDLTDISDINISNDGNINSEITTADLGLVMSGSGGAYAVKRSPEVKFFENITHDNNHITATMRNGFQQVRAASDGSQTFLRAVASQSGVGSSSASLSQFSKAIANLRADNAPSSGGYYWAFITPAQELALASELNGVGGISSGSIGSVAQDMANDALLQGLVSQALGANFVRSTALPQGIASA